MKLDLDTAHFDFTSGVEYAELAAKLHQQCFESPWGEASFHSALTIPGTIAQFLSLEDNPIAFALYRQLQEEAEILTFCVLPDYRKSGCGRKLLESGLAHFKKAKIRSIFLEVSETNTAAINLYKDAGFTQIGRRKNYYAGAGVRQDALILKHSCTM